MCWRSPRRARTRRPAAAPWYPAIPGLQDSTSLSAPTRNNDFGLFGEGWFEVTAGQAGLWRLRYGADFGRGGWLYVDEVAIEEAWNSDVWWDNNFNNTAGALEASISLGAGWHSFRAPGFVGCCDGQQGFEFEQPGGRFLGDTGSGGPKVRSFFKTPVQ